MYRISKNPYLIQWNHILRIEITMRRFYWQFQYPNLVDTIVKLIIHIPCQFNFITNRGKSFVRKLQRITTGDSIIHTYIYFHSLFRLRLTKYWPIDCKYVSYIYFFFHPLLFLPSNLYLLHGFLCCVRHRLFISKRSIRNV